MSVMLARALEHNRKQPQDALWTDKPAFEKQIENLEPIQPDEDYVLMGSTAWRCHRPRGGRL